MGDDESDHAPRWPWRRPWFLILPFAVAGFSIFGLLFLGDRGSYLVAVLALFVGFAAAVVPPLMQYLREQPKQVKQQVSKEGKSESAGWFGTWPPRTRVPKRRFPWRTVVSFAGMLALGGLVAWGAYTLVQSPVTASQSVMVENARDLTAEQPARVIFQGTTPNRAYLGLRLSLDDYVGTGDCATYAHATLVPRLGGIQGRPVEVEALGTATQEPSETPIETGGAIQDLSVEVLYRADPGCRVGLTVTGATFYGRY